MEMVVDNRFRFALMKKQTRILKICVHAHIIYFNRDDIHDDSYRVITFRKTLHGLWLFHCYSTDELGPILINEYDGIKLSENLLN